MAYLLPGDGPARRFDLVSGDLAIDRETPLRDFPDHTGSLGLIDPAGPAWDASLDVSPTGYTPVGVAFAGPRRDYLLLDRRSHRLTLALADGERLETDVSGRWGNNDRTGRAPSRVLPARDAAGALYLAGPGVLHRLDGGAAVRVLPDLYQPRPIFDASTGALVGGHDDGRIQWLDGRAVGPELVPAPDAGLDGIRSVAFASSGKAYAALSAIHGERRTLTIRAEGRGSRRIDCPVNLEGRPAPTPPASLAVEDWGGPGRPLMVRRRTLPDGSRGLVVIWRGGPGETFTGGGAASFEREWLERGFDVALVDGGGSQGVELGRRLREGGLDAVLADAADVARHLASNRPASWPVLIEGGSFGGIAAAETARLLAQARPDAPPPPLLLIAPWMRYRDPADYNGEGRERLNVDFMRGSDTPPSATSRPTPRPWTAGGRCTPTTAPRWRCSPAPTARSCRRTCGRPPKARSPPGHA